MAKITTNLTFEIKKQIEYLKHRNKKEAQNVIFYLKNNMLNNKKKKKKILQWILNSVLVNQVFERIAY